MSSKDIIKEPIRIEKKSTSKDRVGKTEKTEKVTAKRDDTFRTVLKCIMMAVWVFAVLYIVKYLVAFVFRWLLTDDQLMSNVTNSIYQVIVYALALVITIFVPKKALKMGVTRDEVGLKGLPTWTDFLLAPAGLIATLIMAGILTAIMMGFLPDINWEQTQEVGYSGLYQFKDFILAFICLVIIAPVCEEVIFRGWLYGKIRARIPAVPAILIVSALFGIVHEQWNVGVTVFAMSVGMCIMRELTGTIWGGILLHMIKNGLAFYILFVLAG